MIKPVKSKGGSIVVSDKHFFPQQKGALEFLYNFLNGNKQEAVLKGYAGTGKTYILNYFVNKICNIPVCPTAPTHKAVRQIEKSINKKGRTLQSLHGLRPNLDISNFDISNPQFDPKGNTYIKNYKIVIIDEASMITDDIFYLNRKRAKEYGVKILYVGDPLQLPPVQKGKTKAKGSLAFDLENSYELTEIVRQEEGNPLLELFPLIRDDIKNNTNNFINHIIKHRSNIVDGVGYEVLSDRNFKDVLLRDTKDLLVRDKYSDTRVLAFTNTAVNENNKFIRHNIIEHDNKIITEDDIFTSYTTLVDEFYDSIIINSEDYSVDNIRDYINNYDIKTYALSLKTDYSSMPTNTLQIVDHRDKSFKRYYSILDLLHRTALNSSKSDRASNWKKYYDFKDSILTMVNFKLSSGATVKKDIDYGYAITIHKSQGSTYDNVYVDLSDILFYNINGKKVRRPGDVNRLIYVAISRARNKVTMKL